MFSAVQGRRGRVRGKIRIHCPGSAAAPINGVRRWGDAVHRSTVARIPGLRQHAGGYVDKAGNTNAVKR